MLTKQDGTVVRNIVREEMKIELGPIKKTISKIQKDIKVIISLFDRDYIHLVKRVDRVDNHLKLPPLSTQT